MKKKENSRFEHLFRLPLQLFLKIELETKQSYYITLFAKEALLNISIK